MLVSSFSVSRYETQIFRALSDIDQGHLYLVYGLAACNLLADPITGLHGFGMSAGDLVDSAITPGNLRPVHGSRLRAGG